MGGDLDLNSAVTGPSHFVISTVGSFYTVGPELGGVITGDLPAGYKGCMRLQTSGGAFTFTFVPGGFASGIATTGGILQFNDDSGTASWVSGNLRMQDATAFISGDATALHTNYAFGEHGGSPIGRFSIAGSFVLDPASGMVSSFTADQNDAGMPSTLSETGSISAVSSLDGRAISSFTPQVPPSAASKSVFYIVNANEIFILGADAFGPGSAIRSGQAVVSNSPYAASSIAGNQIIHTTGQGVCKVNNVTTPCANAALGLLNLSANLSTTGTFTGTVFQYDIQNGPQTTSYKSGSSGTFALASSAGRVTLGNAGATPPVLYLASPTSNTEPVTFFIVGTDQAASFGYAEQGASAAIANSSLVGSYFVVNYDSGDSSVWAQIGILSGFPYSAAGTWDYDWSGLQLLNTIANEYNAPLNITNLDPNNNPAPGLGTAGVGVVAITNGKRILCLLEGGQFPKPVVSVGGTAAVVVIAEPQ